MKLTMNGLVIDVYNMKSMLKDALIGNTTSLKYFTRDIRSEVIESIASRGSDFVTGSQIADYIGVDVNDALVHSVFDVVVDGLYDGIYVWENVSVDFEDGAYMECYFDIEVDIDSILIELE